MNSPTRSPPFAKTVLLVTLAILVATTSSAKPCGAFNLLDGVLQLNQTDFIRAKNDFGGDDNGKAMSVFGWFQIDDTSARQHSLLRLIMTADKNSTSTPASFSDFAKVVYDTTDPNKHQLIVTSAYDDKEIKSESFALNLPQKTWLFLTYTFDYAQGIAALYIKGRSDATGEATKFYGEVKVAYPTFVIPQIMTLEIGCFAKDTYTEAEKKAALKTCMRGSLRDFFLMLEFTKDPSNAYMMKTPETAISTLFKFQDDKGAFITAPIIRESQGLSVALTKKNINFEPNVSTVVYELPNVGALSIGEFHAAFTMFFELSFNETIEDKFLMFAQRLKNEDTKNHMEINLIKDGANRKIELTFPSVPSITFTSDATLTASKVHKIAIALSVYSSRNIAGIINIDGVSKSFEGIAADVLKNGPMFIASSSHLTMMTFGIIPNAAGAAFMSVRDPISWSTSTCSGNCYLANTLNYGAQSCMVCESKWMSTNHKCATVCPKGYFGVTDTCVKCEQQTCSELNLARFFSIKKTSPTTFIVTPSSALMNFENKFENMVVPTIAEAKPDTDYKVTMTPGPNQSATYVFEMLGERNWSESSVKFSAPTTTVIHDQTKTLIQGAAIEIPYKADFNNEEMTKKLSSAPQITSIPDSNGMAGEFINEQAESDVGKLAIAAFAIFLFGMLLGIVGIFVKCRLIGNSPFFYQKVIQSFLMFQYMTFWLFYNSQLPRNLLSFLRNLYLYSVNFHQIFNKPAMDNFGEDKNFTANWSFLGDWRFMKEGVLNSFVLNFGLIFIIQAGFVLLYFVFKLVWFFIARRRSQAYETVDAENPVQGPHIVPNSMMTHDCDATAPFMQRLVQMFEWKILVTVFSIFVIESTVFSLYNLIHFNFDHSFWTFSFAWSVIYFSLVTLTVFAILFISLLPPSTLHVETFAQRFGFIYEGFERSPLKRSFQGLQYVHYLLFSIFLVAAFPERLVQIIPNLVFMILMFGLTLSQPAAEKFDKIEQIISHALLLIAKIFLAAIVIDDSGLNMTGEQRWILGYCCLIAMFILIIWNTFVILYKFIEYWVQCSRYERQNTFGTLMPVTNEMKSMKSSLPPAMQADVDGSNRIIGFDEEKNQLFLTSQQYVPTSGMDIPIGTKKSIHLDKYIEGDGSHRLTKANENDALTFAQSNAFLTNNKQTTLNSHGSIMNKPTGMINLVQSAPQGELMNNLNSQRFSEKVVTNNNIQESTVQNTQMPPSQRDKDLESKLQSLKNIGSVRNNLVTSQATEMNFSMANSYTSDRFTPVEPGSIRDMPKGENFSKVKASKIGDMQGDTQNIIIEESQNPDSFFEQPKESSSKNFFE